MEFQRKPIGCFGIFILLMMFVYVYKSVTENPWLLIPIIAIIITIVLVIYAYRRSLRPKELNEELLKIESMDGFDFERYTAKLLEYNGYKNVQVTQASGDYGADVIGYKNGYRYVFQCKCYSSNLGVKAVQEIYSAKQHYNADIAVVLIKTSFSKNAKILAEETGVQLWDRNNLINLIKVSIKNKKGTQSDQSQLKQESPITSRQFTQPFVYTNPESKPTTITTTRLEQQPFVIPPQLENMKEFNMATRIGAGKYEFGKNIPVGGYDLKLIQGCGLLEITNRHNKNRHDDEVNSLYMNMDQAMEYKNVSGIEGDYFTLSGTMIVEIKKAAMLSIE